MNIPKLLSADYILKTANKAKADVFGAPFSGRVFSTLPDKFIKAKAAASKPAVVDEKYLKELAEKMYRDAKRDFSEYMTTFKKVFGDTGIPISGRIKDPSSAFSKLSKRAFCIEEGYNPMSLVPDIYGFRLTTDGSLGQMEIVTKKLESLVDDGILMPAHILNHGAIPYFSEDQLRRLEGKGFFISNNAKKAGFSGVNMYFEDIFTQKKVELQIRGKKVNKLAEKEHLWYNFKTKGKASKRGDTIERFQKAFEQLTEEQTKLYEKYVDDCYRYSRNSELGNITAKPSLPEGLSKILSLL